MTEITLAQPVEHLRIARDPRVPHDRNVFSLALPNTIHPVRTEWTIDGEPVATTAAGVTTHPWPLVPGAHTASARVWMSAQDAPLVAPPVTFYVR